MLDARTGRAIRVLTAGDVSPYLMVTVLQRDQIHELLDRHEISHWLESGSVSLDGRPPVSVINFGRGADVARIQAILDQVQ